MTDNGESRVISLWPFLPTNPEVRRFVSLSVEALLRSRSLSRFIGAALVVSILAGATACADEGALPVGSGPSVSDDSATSPAEPASDSYRIGDRSLFMECRGSKGPTIVLEAGLTGDHRTWDRVLLAAPPEIRMCAYDRANIENSDPAPTPRSAQDVVTDLEALLSAAGEDPPYVLAGFSFGGVFTQLFSAQHPNQVAGLVLIESNHPDEAREFERHLTRRQIAEDRAMAKDNPEGIDIYGSFNEVRRAGALPDMPLVVVTATRNEGVWPPGWDSTVFDRLRARQQADLADLVPGGEQLFAKGSGHDVPSERPDVVVDAILQVLREFELSE